MTKNRPKRIGVHLDRWNYIGILFLICIELKNLMLVAAKIGLPLQSTV